MSYLRSGIVVGLLVFLIVLVGTPAGVQAHLKEDFVAWEIGFDNVRFNGPPVITEMDRPGAVPVVAEADAQNEFPIIQMNTGDRLRIDYSFTFVSDVEHLGDLFWITRLGLDFGTLGRYVNGEWIGGRSFLLEPGETYDATLVIRSIQPTLRHLHVGLSINDVGNIPAALSPDPAIPTTEIPPVFIEEGGPVLYGVFTDATGDVAEPIDPDDVEGLDVPLLAPWPWAVAGVFAQIAIGLGFIAVMFWYGRRKAGGG